MTHPDTLAKYKWTKEGILRNEYIVELYQHGSDVHVYGFDIVPSTVADAIRFMYVHRAKKLVVDEFTIVLVQE